MSLGHKSEFSGLLLSWLVPKKYRSKWAKKKKKKGFERIIFPVHEGTATPEEWSHRAQLTARLLSDQLVRDLEPPTTTIVSGGDVPNILQEVQVPIVTNGECQKMYLYAGHEKLIRSHFVCAGYSRGGQDSCEGDSGGPLMVQRDDGRWVLVGTVSHGIGCADPNLPGVYMRMSAYRPWIDSIIRRRKVVRQKQVNSTAVISKKTRRSRTLVFFI